MTREEAIKELSCIADEMPSMECANWIEAISMAIKALEQEPVLDKIRVKIAEEAESTANGNRAGGLYKALQIIDKYKTESEMQE